MKLRMTHKDRLSRFEGEALIAALGTMDPLVLRIMHGAQRKALHRAGQKLVRCVEDARSREFAARIRRI